MHRKLRKGESHAELNFLNYVMLQHGDAYTEGILKASRELSK